MASTWEHETWYTWMWLSSLTFLIYHDLHQQSSQCFILYSWEPPCYKWLGNQDFNSNHFLHVFKYIDFLSPKFVNTSDRLGLRKKWSISLLLGNCELAISVCLREKIQKFPTGHSCCFWNQLNKCWKTVLRRFKHANTFLHLLHFLPRMRQFPHSVKK